MILGDPGQAAGGATLDELFRRAGVRSPDALALIDPPNRQGLHGAAPRQLTYAETDRLISAFAARLRGLGLRSDAIVALQLANTVESVIALLGVLRAGMIAAPLPLLWRQQEIVAALRGVGAKAIVTYGAAPARRAMLAAVELFPIRHVCAFGHDLPDGVVPLDDVFAVDAPDCEPGSPRAGPAAAHVAVVTFDVTAAGVTALARNHLQLMAGGLGVFLETGMAQAANILSAIPPTSFSGIALTLLPWLFSGGTLALHHGGDPELLAAQCGGLADTTLMLPGPALAPLAEAGRLDAGVKTIAALWRAPERLAVDPRWPGEAALVDVASFGETGLVASRRACDGLPAPIPHGSVGAPRGAAGAVTVAETARTRLGTLALRGPMMPQPFPPGAEAGGAPDGFLDTGYTCRLEGDGLTVTGPPGGVLAVGGYRFSQQSLDAELASIDPAATLMAVPHGILGQRLAGAAPDPLAARAALHERGVNPLIADAFRAPDQADAA